MQIDISNLFAEIKIIGVHETSLAGNQWKEDLKSFDWKKEREFADSFRSISQRSFFLLFYSFLYEDHLLVTELGREKSGQQFKLVMDNSELTTDDLS